MKNIYSCIFACVALHASLNAQNQDTIKNTYQYTAPSIQYIQSIQIQPVVVSASKIEEEKRNVAQQIDVVGAAEISRINAQSTADLLSNNGNVFVQKSQAGGGSPILRGFEANKVLLVIDGVRMNNLIYRGGHLQNVITVDNNNLERMEVLFGPSSTVYGSDALGGVISLHTKRAQFSSDENNLIKVNAFTRYGSVNSELTGHFDFNFGTKKFASITSFTGSNFGDLMGGKNQNPFYTSSYGERPYYVERINGKDSLVKNSNRYLQKQSAYKQIDFMQKFAYKQNDNITHNINFQYSTSTDVPRYDRLTDPSGAGLKFAEWYYGPQKRMLAAYTFNYVNNEAFFQIINATVSYQSIEESRVQRRFNNKNLQSRIENVNVVGLNTDFVRTINKNRIQLGIDGQYNSLKSTANVVDITTNTKSPLDTRYPSGKNTMSNLALYISHQYRISPTLTINDGARIGFTNLYSQFNDTTFFNFPFKDVKQQNLVYSGSASIVNNPNDHLKLSALIATGYRAPNVDDLAKVFESATATLIVPNSDLKPEKTVSSELGISNVFNKITTWESSVYYTQIYDAIVTDKFTYQGKDSVMYNGTLSSVQANQNKRKAYIYGFSTGIKSRCNDFFTIAFNLNYTYGRFKTDSTDMPLDHIAPVTSKLLLSYNNKNFSSDFYVNYNGWKKIKNYLLNAEDNEAYATPDGMPAWFTLNLKMSYKVHKLFTLQAGVENILDTQYRTFASGINGAGRNFYAALRFNL